jgi:hypothetical protein
MSFSQKRRALLHAATARSRGTGVARSVPFTNEDVPRFLRDLKRFVQESRKVRIAAR